VLDSSSVGFAAVARYFLSNGGRKDSGSLLPKPPQPWIPPSDLVLQVRLCMDVSEMGAILEWSSGVFKQRTNFFHTNNAENN